MTRYQADEKLVLVKHQPGKKRKQYLTLLLAVVVSAAIAYSFGKYEVQSQHLDAVAKLEQVSKEYDSARKNELAFRQQVANLESGRAIDAQAKQEIQDTIQSLSATVAQLKKDISFYQNIMAPSDNSRGLQIQTVELAPSSSEGRYNYKVVLTQVADNKTYVSGLVVVNLTGTKNDEPVVIPLRDVSSEEELGIKFRFRYFQDITGELMLPEGFVPQGLQIVAQSKGKKASKVEQSFDWQQALK